MFPLKQLIPVAGAVLLASWGCDSNVAAPTRSEMTSRAAAPVPGVVAPVLVSTFVGRGGLAMTCTVADGVLSHPSSPVPPMTSSIPQLGNPIPLLLNPTQSEIVVTTLLPPRIALNPTFFPALPLSVQAFVFFRECGRFNITPASEPAFLTGASCWSIRRLRDMNLFAASDREAIRRFLERTFPFATGIAPNGADQFRLMQSCL
jgi:hypothetical protein